MQVGAAVVMLEDLGVGLGGGGHADRADLIHADAVAKAGAAVQILEFNANKASDLQIDDVLLYEPGVTTRITLRSTGPLAVATSPTCSAIATASPILISLAR